MVKRKSTKLQFQTQMKILLVDDDGFIIFTMRNLLTKMGFLLVETAKNGSEAVDLVLTANKQKLTSFSLILMDINMPIMNGYEAAKTINEAIQNGFIHHVPIMAVTAQDSEDHEQKINQAGIIATGM